jgi:hypothetical protein
MQVSDPKIGYHGERTTIKLASAWTYLNVPIIRRGLLGTLK